MTLYIEHFMCDECKCKDFKRIYNFSLRFHGVNFSDDLIYDRSAEEIYQCTNCKKRFTANEIEEGLTELKQKVRNRTASSISTE